VYYVIYCVGYVVTTDWLLFYALLLSAVLTLRIVLFICCCCGLPVCTVIPRWFVTLLLHVTRCRCAGRFVRCCVDVVVTLYRCYYVPCRCCSPRCIRALFWFVAVVVVVRCSVTLLRCYVGSVPRFTVLRYRLRVVPLVVWRWTFDCCVGYPFVAFTLRCVVTLRVAIVVWFVTFLPVVLLLGCRFTVVVVCTLTCVLVVTLLFLPLVVVTVPHFVVVTVTVVGVGYVTLRSFVR